MLVPVPQLVRLFVLDVEEVETGGGAQLDEQSDQTEAPLGSHDSCLRPVGSQQHDLQEGGHGGDAAQQTDGVERGHLGQHAEDENGQAERVQCLDCHNLRAAVA